MRRKNYDDDLLVELIASGQMSYVGIAKRVGTSRSNVWHIATGRRRPELQPRIRQAVRANRLEARRLAAKWLKALIGKHIKDGMEGDDEKARKCREFAINKFLEESDDEQDIASTSDEDQSRPPGLTADDYEAIAKLKDGPADDDQTED